MWSEACLQIDRAVRDDALSLSQTALDGKTLVMLRPGLNSHCQEVTLLCLDEDTLLTANPNHRGFGNPECRSHRVRVMHAAKHLGTEPAARVVEFRSHLDGSGV